MKCWVDFEKMVKCSGNKCMSGRRRGTEMPTLKKRFLFFETFFNRKVAYNPFIAQTLSKTR